MATKTSSVYDLPAEKLTTDEKAIDDRKREYLCKAGWLLTSDTPGFHWMYQKEWRWKTLLVDRNSAFKIQSHWDAEAYMKQHPEEYRD
jgi:hypothetical protein